MDDATKHLLARAYDAFRAGWATGDWEPFVATLADEVVFQFPAGPYKGRHTGRDGAAKLAAWARAYGDSGDRITIEPELVAFGDDCGMFAEVSRGVEGGRPYEGRELIVLRVAGGKVVEYREYIGDITDWVRLEQTAGAAADALATEPAA